MLLVLGRRVSLSFVKRVIPQDPVLLSKPILQNFRTIQFRVIHSSTVFAIATRQNTDTMPERRPFVRLPTDVYPVNYGLCLKPDLIDFTFEGKLEAIVEVGEVIERQFVSYLVHGYVIYFAYCTTFKWRTAKC